MARLPDMLDVVVHGLVNQWAAGGWWVDEDGLVPDRAPVEVGWVAFWMGERVALDVWAATIIAPPTLWVEGLWSPI